ncbi:MAG: TraM recognition domain-containing protein, partial [Acidobacteria bacterium]|nr:TraM recognition domain-containing protein [Acidobacteriota bacterium]
QSFVTTGEKDPAGDEKAFALTRQSRCIPIVATQSISSLRSVLGDGEVWRTLIQTLRSRIFLSLADDASLKTASDLLGQVNRMRASFSLSENTARAAASWLTGRMGGGSASAGLSKSYAEKREPLFHPRDIALLETCQAVAQIFDGDRVHEGTRVYLKPDYKPRDLPYWRWREELERDKVA